MTTYAYQEMRNNFQQLSLDEQLRLLEDLAEQIRQQLSLKQVPPKRKHDITELRGLGKEIWEGVDVAKYIDDERNSWDR
ncbi:MAG TPA: hypothetical protein VNG51_27250 [Ktedonobacteraceae bacterium]|nr:hypothetical protein [Ktedonobacteraceae bacterium]